MKKYVLRFDSPAENGLAGWVNRSFMLGNGYFGANVFGGTASERVSFSEQSLFVSGTEYINERYCAGNECFSFLHIDTSHNNVKTKNYNRELCLNNGIATVEYDFNEVHYTREYFASYPDKVFVIRLTADKPGELSFKVRPRIAYERERLLIPNDGFSKRGTVSAYDEATLEIDGLLESYDMKMHMFTRVTSTDGIVRITEENGQLALDVSDATEARILVTLGTDYDMNKVIFQLPDGIDSPKNNVANNQRLKNCPDKRGVYLDALISADKYTYDELKEHHLADFEAIFNRVEVDFGGKDDGRPTDKVLLLYKVGEPSAYLEELHFQMGRYMLLCCSRNGGLPASLQGIWNMFDFVPWTCGFWYNINIQMCYWPAFVCNLQECFDAYHNFNKARFEGCGRLADAYIRRLHPEKYTEGAGKNGWIVGTENSSVKIGGVGGHSGPGTGGLTTKAYWDMYDFTRDTELLKNEAYPFLEAVARFYVKCVEKFGDKLLVTHSSSPEQKVDGIPYVTTGCLFDQQMLHESISDYIRASDIIGLDSGLVDIELYREAKAQADKYDPILIGTSGQIKEYREENAYGEIGDLDHRHISQLVCAFPGTLVNRENEAWSDSAKETVILRGLTRGKGWSKAHKMLVLARNNGTNEVLQIAESALRENVFDNLWNDHCGVSVFQADANFGMTAAYAEILVQSHAGYIDVLPQVPEKWKTGHFDGLRARGNFVVGASWENGAVTQVRIHANLSGRCMLRCQDLSNACLKASDGKEITYNIVDGKIEFEAKAGEDYILSGIRMKDCPGYVEELNGVVQDKNVTLTWTYGDVGATYAVYKAEDSASSYTLIKDGITGMHFEDCISGTRATYKVCVESASGNKDGRIIFVS